MAATLVRSYIKLNAGFGTGATQASVDTSGGDLLLVYTIGGYNEGATNLPSGVTFNGSAMTLHGSTFSTVTTPGIALYRQIAPSGTFSVVGTWAANGYFALVIEVWSGADQTTPLRTSSASRASTGTNATTTYTSGQTGDIITAACGIYLVTTLSETATVDASQTEVQNGSMGATAGKVVAATSYEAGAASVVMNWALSASDGRWAVLASAIVPVAAATDGARLVGGTLIGGILSRGLLAG